MRNPISPAMSGLLEYIRGGGAIVFVYAGTYDPYFIRIDNQKKCTKQVDALIARGYLKQHGKTVELTKKGTQQATQQASP